MTRRFGIDASVLVRLLTRHPKAEFEHCVSKLHEMVDQGAEVFASNQVIGEAYVAVQHHYGLSNADARASSRDALRSGLVVPLNGRRVIAALEATGVGRLRGVVGALMSGVRVLYSPASSVVGANSL